MTRRPPPRRGVTLTEVLVALFVMALGMTALLTLFPLGAFQIGQALKDDRCTQTALQADGIIRSYWRHQVAAPPANGLPANPPALVWAMDDPNLSAKWPHPTSGAPMNTYLQSGFRLPTSPPLPSPVTIPNTNPAFPVSPTQITAERYLTPQPPAAFPDTFFVTPRGPGGTGPSFPALLDPVGFLARGTTAEHLWAGRGPANVSAPLLVPRRNFGVPPAPGLPFVDPVAPSLNAAFAQGFLTDDLAFEPNGAPQAIDPTTGMPFSNGAQLQRQGRYSWAALIQRPRNDRPATADLTILVFDGRPATSVPIGDEHVAQVPQFNPAAGPNPNPNGEEWLPGRRTAVVTVPSRTPEQTPLVRKGGWVMDGTIDISPMSASPTPGLPIPHPARFYRIVGVTELSVAPPPGNTTYALDLDAPIQQPLGTPPVSQLYFFANLAEVFPRPQLTPYDR